MFQGLASRAFQILLPEKLCKNGGVAELSFLFSSIIRSVSGVLHIGTQVEMLHIVERQWNNASSSGVFMKHFALLRKV